jgi:hypothetical protein
MHAEELLIACIAHAAQRLGYSHIKPSPACNTATAVVTIYRQEGDHVIAVDLYASQQPATGKITVSQLSNQYPVARLPKQARPI